MLVIEMTMIRICELPVWYKCLDIRKVNGSVGFSISVEANY